MSQLVLPQNAEEVGRLLSIQHRNCGCKTLYAHVFSYRSSAAYSRYSALRHAAKRTAFETQVVGYHVLS